MYLNCIVPSTRRKIKVEPLAKLKNSLKKNLKKKKQMLSLGLIVSGTVSKKRS